MYGLPNDPVILLGVINTKLRDYYTSLDLLCEDLKLEKEDLISCLKRIDYEYDETTNQFI